MTSKEALQIMLEFTAPQGEKQHLECSEAYLKLNRDLDILDILKSSLILIENKQITLGYGKYKLVIRPDVILSDDTIKIIKEWLDNGNNN